MPAVTYVYSLKARQCLHHFRHGLVIYRLLQIALHYYQSVRKHLWLLLKQEEAGLYSYGECLF
jgi:hypothetical protein